MKQPAKLSIAGVVAAILAAIFYPKLAGSDAKTPEGNAPVESQAPVLPGGSPVLPDPALAKAKVDVPAAKTDATPAPATNKPATPAPVVSKPEAKPVVSKVGFTSRASWLDHFEKHGKEFGRISADEYLAKAQALRDAPLSKDILEAVREKDGVITRFDRKGGGFLAFHKDKTIRTFFRPNDGEAYFQRQLNRLPQDGR